MQERAVQLLHAPAAGGARLLKSGLTVSNRDNGGGLQGEWRLQEGAGDGFVRQPVSPFVSRAVSLKNKARQGFEAYCLGHCLAGVATAAQLSRCPTR